MTLVNPGCIMWKLEILNQLHSRRLPRGITAMSKSMTLNIVHEGSLTFRLNNGGCQTAHDEVQSLRMCYGFRMPDCSEGHVLD